MKREENQMIKKHITITISNPKLLAAITKRALEEGFNLDGFFCKMLLCRQLNLNPDILCN